MNENSKTNLLTIQQIASFFFILTIIVSIYLTEIEKNNTKYNKDHDTFKTNLINRYIILIITIIFFYTSYKLYELAKKEKKLLKSYEIQLFVSLITVLLAIIGVYSLKVSKSLANFENPEI